MKKLIIILAVVAAVYYGVIQIKKPTQEDLQRVLPVQVDPRKGKELVDKAERVKKRANEAISDIQEEVQK